MEIIEFERLCHSEAASKAAFSASNILIEKGFIRWPAACWDEPIIAVMDGDKCVAGINYSKDEKHLCATVEFAFCDEAKPAAFVMALLRARKIAAEAKLSEIRFTAHGGNEPMQKLAAKLKLKPHSMSYRVPVAVAA